MYYTQDNVITKHSSFLLIIIFFINLFYTSSVNAYITSDDFFEESAVTKSRFSQKQLDVIADGLILRKTTLNNWRYNSGFTRLQQDDNPHVQYRGETPEWQQPEGHIERFLQAVFPGLSDLTYLNRTNQFIYKLDFNEQRNTFVCNIEYTIARISTLINSLESFNPEIFNTRKWSYNSANKDDYYSLMAYYLSVQCAHNSNYKKSQGALSAGRLILNTSYTSDSYLVCMDLLSYL